MDTRGGAVRIDALGRQMKEPDNLAVAVAGHLRRYLETHRLTNRQFSYKAGVDERTIRRVLHAQDVKLSTLSKLAAVLAVEVAALLKRDAA